MVLKHLKNVYITKKSQILRCKTVVTGTDPPTVLSASLQYFAINNNVQN